MMKLTRSGLVGLVFLAGCAVGGASSRLVEPAKAYAGPRWEHRCINFGATPGADEVEAESNQLGAHGYEIVAVDRGYWCFKRPM